MGVRMYFYQAEYHDYTPIFSCLSAQSADMEKAETSGLTIKHLETFLV